MPWEKQDDLLFTFFSFINVWKYPPSLLYMCITIGPSLLLLAYVEGIKNKLSDALVVFGRTAFFYYILHLYTLHFLAMIVYFVRGHEFSYLDPSGKPMQFLFVIPGEGYNLAGVYLVWFLVVIGLYKICQRYDQYKILHREKWWLSYLWKNRKNNSDLILKYRRKKKYCLDSLHFIAFRVLGQFSKAQFFYKWRDTHSKAPS